MYGKHRYLLITASTVLVLVICATMLLVARNQAKLIKQQVHEEANAILRQLVITRRWNSEYGGVYVKARPGDKPNPYLKIPLIYDTLGNVYYQKNPALMTRELSLYAAREDSFKYNITSLKPLNPTNLPDDWERGQLAAFGKGKTGVSEIIEKDGRHYYRLMRPLFIEKVCLKCHEEQGYKLGDVRGGISVTLPYDRYRREVTVNTMAMAGAAVLLVVLLVMVLRLFWRMSGRLALQNAELEEAYEMKDRLVGIAAHDLRNPLTVVAGYAELLESSLPDSKDKDLVFGIREASDRMLALIHEILETSNLNRGRIQIKPSRIDVAGFLSDCLDSTRPIAEKKGIALKLDVVAGTGDAEFDPERIGQAVSNLIGNAIKYSHPGSDVTLGAGRDYGRLEIWVEDHGVGIKEDELPHLFEEFSRTSSRPTGGETSFGLGLAITRRIVELHGGTIEAKSTLGAGSRFTVRLPQEKT